jgi:hypothetical protein
MDEINVVGYGNNLSIDIMILANAIFGSTVCTVDQGYALHLRDQRRQIAADSVVYGTVPFLGAFVVILQRQLNIA